MKTIDRETFIVAYCEASGMTREMIDSILVAVECDCGEDGCQGWRMESK